MEITPQQINELIEAGWCFPHNCRDHDCGGPHNYEGAPTADELPTIWLQN